MLSRNKWLWAGALAVAVVAAGLWMATASERSVSAGCGMGGCAMVGAADVQPGGMTCGCCAGGKCPHAESLASAVKAIDAAKKAVESGDGKAALTELEKAGKLLADVQATMGKCAAATHPAAGKAAYVNARCPIMGGPIYPAKVTDALMREYKGQKVAFCCGGCPGAWDKLSDAEKDAKLQAAVGGK